MKTELRADTRSGARRFWDQEIAWRANALYHNDVLNFPVKLMTGSRMDDPATIGRVTTAVASLVPLTRMVGATRSASAVSRAFGGLSTVPNKSRVMRAGEVVGESYVRGVPLFETVSSVPTATDAGRAAVSAAEAEYLSGFGGKAFSTLSRLASPVRSLAEMLFRTKAPEVGTGTRTLIDLASTAAEVPIVKAVYSEALGGIDASRTEKAVKTSGGVPSGTGDVYVSSQTNSIPAAVSQDAKVNRDLIRKAYREYDSTTNKVAFTEALRSIIEDKAAVAAVKDLNSTEFYAKTHKGQSLSRLKQGIESIGDESARARLQKVLDDHNAAFSALDIREQLTGGM